MGVEAGVEITALQGVQHEIGEAITMSAKISASEITCLVECKVFVAGQFGAYSVDVRGNYDIEHMICKIDADFGDLLSAHEIAMYVIAYAMVDVLDNL
jgi:hypothetical protein